MRRTLGYKDPITKRLVVNCLNYAPCPICDRCDVAGMFLKCERCIASGPRVERCHHDHKTRCMIIRRENFAITANIPTSNPT